MTVYRGELFSQNDIWLYDIARSTTRRLTYGGAPAIAVWSPDGSEIVYDKLFVDRLFRVRADGSGGSGEMFSTRERDGAPMSWSRADDMLVFSERGTAAGSRLWIQPMGAAGEATLLKERPFNVFYLQFSPDGRWLSYASNETGSMEVYVEPYPGSGAAVRISPDGGHSPAWAGNELFYLRQVGDRTQMMGVDVDTTGAELRAGVPRPLFELPADVAGASLTGPVRTYDVAPDGRRFIMSKLTSASPDPITQIHVILNWTEELERRVPVK
jgi:dipeptidyl aminopeptidase/acylaminoacyl peptidase